MSLEGLAARRKGSYSKNDGNVSEGVSLKKLSLAQSGTVLSSDLGAVNLMSQVGTPPPTTQPHTTRIVKESWFPYT